VSRICHIVLDCGQRKKNDSITSHVSEDAKTGLTKTVVSGLVDRPPQWKTVREPRFEDGAKANPCGWGE